MSPSIPEIGRKFKIASTNGVSDHLKALEKKGYIRRVGKRAIEVMSALGKPVPNATLEVPVLGRVSAGKRFLGEENIEGMITIPEDMGSGKRFALEVKGDSIIRGDTGRRPGDPQAAVHGGNGEIVCALIEGGGDAQMVFQERRRRHAQGGE